MQFGLNLSQSLNSCRLYGHDSLVPFLEIQSEAPNKTCKEIQLEPSEHIIAANIEAYANASSLIKLLIF